MSFGIIRSDGSDKPVARALERFAAEARAVVPAPPPIVREEDWYSTMDKAYQQSLYERYITLYLDVHA